MANAISPNTRQFTVPYLTVAEYKSAPTSVDTSNLVLGGDQATQDNELLNNIIRASSWIDTHCFQVLSATQDSEQKTVRVKPDGSISVRPIYFPVIALTAFAYGTNNQNMVSLPDCSVAWIEDQRIEIPSNSTALFDISNLAYASPVRAGEKVKVSYSYVNGYTNTLLAAPANAGDMVITVQDGTGVTPSHRLTAADGSSSETIMVDSSYVFGSTTVSLASPLLYPHATGISISALPAAIKQACILMTSDFLKTRGDTARIMGVVNTPSGNTAQVMSDKEMAVELLIPFVRRF